MITSSVQKQGLIPVKAIAILLLTVLQFTLGGVAHAQPFIFDLQTIPESPTADQPADFLAFFTSCPLPLGENIDGLSNDLRVNDFEIDFFYTLPSSFICGVAPPPFSVTFSMGTLPKGDYTLRAAGVSPLESFPEDMTGLDPIVFEFTVGAPSAQGVPALSSPAVVILALLMLSGMMLFTRHSRMHAMSKTKN